MTDDSLENVYQYAERAFIRMQASEVLTRCLEVANLSPIYKLVESLILAGPESLEVFREVLAETNLRKGQVEDDLQQVLSGLQTNLESYGIHLRSVKRPQGVTRMRPARFLGMIRSQGVMEEEAQTTCLQLFQDARELVISLGANYNILVEVERYLKDWMWGMFYHTVRQGSEVPN